MLVMQKSENVVLLSNSCVVTMLSTTLPLKNVVPDVSFTAVYNVNNVVACVVDYGVVFADGF